MAPEFAEGWNKRATVLCALGDFRKAMDDCKRVLELKPRHFGCLAGLGMCHLGVSEKSEALVWLRKALKIHPGMHNARAILEETEQNELLDSHFAPSIKRI